MGRRLGGVTLGSLLLLAALAAAAARRPGLDLDVVALPVIEVAGLAAILAGGMLAVAVRARAAPVRSARRLGGPTLLVVVVGVALAALSAGLTLRDLDPPADDRQQQAVPGAGDATPTDGESAPATPDVDDGRPELPIVVVLILTATTGLVLLTGRRWLRGRELEPETIRTTAVVTAVRHARTRLEPLSGAPRQAVIDAFAAMESGLVVAGVQRADDQTQQEFVTQVLARIDAPPTAVVALSDVYARARWTSSTITERDRDAAVAALDQILDGHR